MRYADEHIKKPQDFVPRNRLPKVLHFLIIFAGLYGLLIAYFFVSDNQLGFGIWSFLIVAGLAAFITYIVRFNRDLVLATEFQNAMFANAIGMNYLFSIIVRRDGGIVYVDRGLQDFMKNFSRIKHRDLRDIFNIGEVSSEHQNAIMNSLQSMQREQLLCAIRVGEGERKDLVLSIDPIITPGNFTLIRAREYSDKRAEQRGLADQSQVKMDQVESLQALGSKVPMGLFSAKATGEITYVNANLERWLGYDAGEIATRGLKIAHIVADPERAFSNGEYHGELAFRHKVAGTEVFYTMTHIEEKSGVIVAIGGVVYPPEQRYDVKKKSELSANAPHVQHGVVVEPVQENTLLNEAPIAIVQCTATGHLSYANAAFKRLIEHERQALPATLVDLVPAAKRDEARHLLQHILEGAAGHSQLQLELELKGDRLVAVSVFASKSAGQDGATFYLIDVSEQKNLELRFAHSQKMQAVGQLAGGVAHDFNNLLTAMIGFCDLLLMRHPAGDQSFADIMQIKQNANRAANLVRQLLAFSRRQTLQPKNLDVTDLLAELSNLIRRLIGENIELKMIHGRDLGMVKADQGQLEQVIINLAVNARDAMKDGGVLTIRSSSVMIDKSHPVPRQFTAPVGEDNLIPDGEYIMIEVTDTGTGIPVNVLPKIFEPFFSTKEIGSGTGLGLSTVYGIIKQTGGYIYVSSAEGQGTQFHIYFPSYAAEESAKQEAENVERSMQDLTGRETLLLVEDETPVRAFASRALKNKGYTVFEADCAETALELVRDQGSKLDLIITDVIMPGMNGPTMVEKISAEYPDIKVIFISGYAEDIFMNNYGAERSFNFLAKPFTLKQLATKVKEVMSA